MSVVGEEAFVQIGERKCLLDAQLRLNVHATFGNNVVLLRVHPDVAIVPLDADGRTSLPLRPRDDFRLEAIASLLAASNDLESRVARLEATLALNAEKSERQHNAAVADKLMDIERKRRESLQYDAVPLPALPTQPPPTTTSTTSSKLEPAPLKRAVNAEIKAVADRRPQDLQKPVAPVRRPPATRAPPPTSSSTTPAVDTTKTEAPSEEPAAAAAAPSTAAIAATVSPQLSVRKLRATVDAARNVANRASASESPTKSPTPDEQPTDAAVSTVPTSPKAQAVPDVVMEIEGDGSDSDPYADVSDGEDVEPAEPVEPAGVLSALPMVNSTLSTKIQRSRPARNQAGRRLPKRKAVARQPAPQPPRFANQPAEGRGGGRTLPAPRRAGTAVRTDRGAPVVAPASGPSSAVRTDRGVTVVAPVPAAAPGTAVRTDRSTTPIVAPVPVAAPASVAPPQAPSGTSSVATTTAATTTAEEAATTVPPSASSPTPPEPVAAAAPRVVQPVSEHPPPVTISAAAATAAAIAATSPRPVAPPRTRAPVDSAPTATDEPTKSAPPPLLARTMSPPLRAGPLSAMVNNSTSTTTTTTAAAAAAATSVEPSVGPPPPLAARDSARATAPPPGSAPLAPAAPNSIVAKQNNLAAIVAKQAAAQLAGQTVRLGLRNVRPEQIAAPPLPSPPSTLPPQQAAAAAPPVPIEPPAPAAPSPVAPGAVVAAKSDRVKSPGPSRKGRDGSPSRTKSPSRHKSPASRTLSPSARSKSPSRSKSPASQHRERSHRRKKDDNSPTASAGTAAASTVPAVTGDTFLVLFDYAPTTTGDGELKLRVGDIITKLGEDSGWWEGANTTTGETGWFSPDFVKPYKRST